MAQHPSRSVRPELRWPAALGVLVALTLYATLPGTFFPEVRVAVIVLGLALLIPVFAFNPHRLTRESRVMRLLAIAQAVLLLVANHVALVQLLIELIDAQQTDRHILLLAALQVWVTNVIAYALVYWEVDRGGPIARTNRERTALPPADFRFPQDEDHRSAATEVAARSSSATDWEPSFVDYLSLSLTNSMAFSPTDTMPLSHRAKLVMGLQSVAAFVLLALVIARAVNILN